MSRKPGKRPLGPFSPSFMFLSCWLITAANIAHPSAYFTVHAFMHFTRSSLHFSQTAFEADVLAGEVQP